MTSIFVPSNVQSFTSPLQNWPTWLQSWEQAESQKIQFMSETEEIGKTQDLYRLYTGYAAKNVSIRVSSYDVF